MRDYSKISPQFWVGETGREIRKLGTEAQLIALYLLTCPHANMIGIYYLPLAYISHDTGIPIEGASKALQSLCNIHFCRYDEDSEFIWVYEMAVFQIGGPLDPKDKRVKGINDSYQALPNLPFLHDFYEKYHELFLLQNQREQIKKFDSMEAPSKGLLSQEQEQEQEIEQEQEQKQEQEQEEEQAIGATSLRKFAPSGDDVPPISLILLIPLKNHRDFQIHSNMLDEWQKLYPAIDVLQCLRHICGWNQANPQRRKTSQGILKHIHAWLAKEQQKSSQPILTNHPSTPLFQHNRTIAQEWANGNSKIITTITGELPHE